MPNNNYYNEGSWNIICDRCGQKYKREQCKKEWTGLLVCHFCWDRKHPWNLPLPIAIDSLPVIEARPRPSTVYLYNYDPGLSTWGGPYQINPYTLVQDLNWEAWDEFWDGNDQQEYNSTNFPLL